MEPTRLQDLLKRYLDETITGAELAELQQLMSVAGDPLLLDPALEPLLADPKYAVGEDAITRDAVFAAIMQKTGETKAPVIRRIPGGPWLWWAAAVLLVAAGVYWYTSRPDSNRSFAVKERKAGFDLPPGSDGAVLTLSNGHQMMLDSTGNGTLGMQGNARIQKQDGLLSYAHTGSGQEQVAYNTVTTPRGRQFRLALADGTRVWLNAGSAITFPTAFSGKERNVSIEGEVYFEVAKDRQKPFIVQAKQSRIIVLGTHFNVMAYEDERNISTTLAEGSVKIISGVQELKLRPGEQGELSRATGKLSVHAADVEQVLAWTTGRLALANVDFAMLMRQLSRWYDLDIVFLGKVPDLPVGGYIHRDVPLSTILQFLKDNGVRYRAEGKRLTIL